MVERRNCVQNQITIRNNQLIRNKVVGMIITGGQDNVQAVAGQVLGFFAEIGCTFPPFPYVAHSRGWTAEDMEANVRQVTTSADLQYGGLHRSPVSCRRMSDTGIMPAPFTSSKNPLREKRSPSWCARVRSRSSIRALPVT